MTRPWLRYRILAHFNGEMPLITIEVCVFLLKRTHLPKALRHMAETETVARGYYLGKQNGPKVQLRERPETMHSRCFDRISVYLNR